jgi:adenylyltransferase/sulfurtransferase
LVLPAGQQATLLLDFRAEDCELAVFRDGRVLVKGTSDPAIARSLVARYLGA